MATRCYPRGKPAAHTDPTTTGLITNIIASFAAGTSDVRAFTADLGRALAAEINGGLTETLKHLGAMQAFELLERKADGAERYYRFRLG